MITSSEANVQLTEEQIKQIEAVKTQLINIQAEINIHNNVLRKTQGDITKAASEIKALTEEQENIEKKVAELRELKKQIAKENSEATVALGVSRVTAKKVEADIVAAQEVLKTKEKEVNDKQAKIQTDREKLDSQLIQVAQDKALFEKKHSILSAALKACGD